MFRTAARALSLGKEASTSEDGVRDTNPPGVTDAVHRAWLLLERSRSVTLFVRNGATGAVQAHGSGTVSVEPFGGSGMVMRERGRWSGPRGSGAHFADALRWTLDTDIGALRLEQIRRGPDEAAPLVEFVDDGSGSLTPLAPHLCGDDRYEGAVRFVDGVVEVAWRVVGPKKDQEIVRRYR